ncbi:MAG: amino acid adenylation domain-containing protein [Actinomycetota bacterium]|nr:amino acid adenylation domain-containing protein [Actinomycetota bacterium]
MTTTPPITADALIGRVVASQPDDPALVSADETVTFAEVDARSRDLAATLRALEVGAETPVAVALPRSVDHVVATLAIWSAGGVCVPVEHALPERRIARLLAASRAECLIDASGRVQRLPIDPPAAPRTIDGAPGRSAESLAYIFFTSGSTGPPKAVGVPHAGIVNEALWTRDAFGLGIGDRCGWLAAPSFALTRWALWSPLAAGAAVQIAAEGVEWSRLGLRDWLVANRVTWCVVVTALGEQLLALPWPAECALRTLVIGGEQLRSWPWSVPFEVVNSYGVTETCVRLAAWLPRDAAADRLPPIGAPVASTLVRVLDHEWRPVPQGEVGELFVGGAGLARGYLGSPGSTAARFVPDAAGRDGARTYRTGDLVRVSADGALEYVGRAAGDVKVNGLRVNVVEVEAALLEQPSVEDACVVIRSDVGDRARLVAYIVGRPGTRLVAYELADLLAEQLPSAMIPSRFVQLPRIPRLVSGKIDRVGLPAPTESNQLDDDLVASEDELEAAIVAAFTETLDLARISVHDDYLGLGGTSLGLFRVRQLLAERLGARVSVAELFECRTAARMADLLRGPRPSGEVPVRDTTVERPPDPGGAEVEDPDTMDGDARAVPLSRAQRRIWFMDRMRQGSTAYVEIITIHNGRAVRADVLRDVIDELVERHEVLRSTVTLRRHQPVSIVHPHRASRLTTISAVADEDIPAQLAEAGLLAPFDLQWEPPVRFALLSRTPGDDALAVVVHHIVWDGRSAEILVTDLAALYAKAVSGVGHSLPPITTSYTDHVLAERREPATPRLAESAAYWLRRLYGVTPVTWRHQPANCSGPRGAATVELTLPPDFPRTLRALSVATGCTPSMVGAAGVACALRPLHSASEIAICMPVSTRDGRTGSTIGLFLNLVPLRLTVPTGTTWRGLLAATRTVCLEAWEHSDLPYERIVRGARLPGRAAGTDLSRVTFEHVRLPGPVPGPAGGDEGEWRLRWHPGREAKTDLFVGLIETAEGWTIRVLYDTVVLRETDAERFATQLRDMLRQMVDNLDASVPPPRGSGTSVPDATPPTYATVRSAAAAAWCEVLGSASVGPDDNFFDLGGDSTAALRIATKLSATLDMDISLRVVFDTESFADFVGVIWCDEGNPNGPTGQGDVA